MQVDLLNNFLNTLMNTLNSASEYYTKTLTGLLSSLNLSGVYLSLTIKLISAVLFALVSLGIWKSVDHFISPSGVIPTPTPAPTTVPKAETGISVSSLSEGGLLIEQKVVQTALDELISKQAALKPEEFTKLKSYYEKRLKLIMKRLEKTREKKELEAIKKAAALGTTPEEVMGKTELPQPTAQVPTPTPTPTSAQIPTPKKEFPAVIESSPLIEEMIKSIDTIVKEFKKEE